MGQREADSRFVFPERHFAAGIKRGSQQALFGISVLIGFGLTHLIAGAARSAGAAPLLAKVVFREQPSK